MKVRTVRWQEVPLNARVLFNFGGHMARGEKIAIDKVRVNKLNSPGTIDVPIHPELNEDDFVLL